MDLLKDAGRGHRGSVGCISAPTMRNRGGGYAGLRATHLPQVSPGGMGKAEGNMNDREHGHGNQCRTRPAKPDVTQVTVCKVPATSVAFGDSISLNGTSVWVARDEHGGLICVGATAREARQKAKQVLRGQ